MKIILSALIILSLTGCGCFKTPEDKIVYVEVFTSPKFDMPTRPVLVSKGGSSIDVAKNAEKDLLDLQGYATQLEKVLATIKKSQNNK